MKTALTAFQQQCILRQSANMAASEEFAEIVNASSGAKRYIEEGILVPDEISDDTLGRIVSYFQEL